MNIEFQVKLNIRYILRFPLFYDDGLLMVAWGDSGGRFAKFEVSEYVKYIQIKFSTIITISYN